MNGYARISASTGEDERIGLLAEQHPLGLALFLLCIAKAYPYGVLPGSPRAYRAAVIPAAMISDQDIDRALDAQEEVGIVHRYEREGKSCVYVIHYHRYQNVEWFKVKPSELPLPENWCIPDQLAEVIENGNLDRANKRLGTFGVEGVPRPSSGAGEQVLPTSPSAGEHRGSIGGASGEPSSSSSSSGSTSTTPRALELEMEQEANPQPASYRVRLQRRMGSLDETNRTALEAYFDLAATVEDSGAKSDQGKVSRFDELEDLRARFGDDAWRHGLREGVRLGKPFTNYVMAIMRNYQPGSEYDRGNGAPRQSAFDDEQAALERGRAATRQLDEEDEERERQAAAERAAKEAAQ